MAAEIHKFRCSCDKELPDMSFDEFKKHVGEVHGLKTKDELTFSKEMRMHMDGERWFSSVYDCTFLKTGLKFSEFYEASRDKNTKMF